MADALTERQVAVMRRSREAPTGACTTWLARGGLTVAQTGNVCRQLERKGLMQTHPHYRSSWTLTSSGEQWLRSLDAGRPWMVRGWKGAAA